VLKITLMYTSARVESVISRKRKAFEELNRRHGVRRSFLFSQGDFRRHFHVDVRVGLCAGLIKGWWSELCEGRDAIKSIAVATPSLVRTILLAQALSFHIRKLPDDEQCLSDAEAALLNFKYGDGGVAKVRALQEALSVDTLLELDLVLHYQMPIMQQWQLSHSSADVVSALTDGRPGMYIFVLRFWDSKRPAHERGHRTALVIETEGSCRFYDPRHGELQFSNVEYFTSWFADYWATERWDYLLRRGSPPAPPLRLFCLGGHLPRAAENVVLAYQAKHSEMAVRSEEIRTWLMSDLYRA
jgi:hypothetical protein